MAQLKVFCKKESSNIAQKDLENLSGEFPIYGASGMIKHVNFYKQEKPYIAVVKDGAGVGRVMKLPAYSSVIGTLQYIIPNDDIDVDYLAYAMEHMNLSKYYTGAAIPHIYFKDYCNEEMPSHNTEEQQEIAKTLDKVCNLIDNRKEQLTKLDELIKARFVELFGDPFDTTKWPVKKLKDISESMIDGSNVNPDYYELEGEVLFLRIQNVWRNEFRLDDSVYITQEINNKHYYDTSLKTGDLLITKIGRYYTKDSSLGRVSVYRGEDNCANYSNNIMRIRLNNTINSDFVNVLLNLDDYQSYIKHTSKGGTDKRALSKSLIGSYPIITPPIYLQNEFVSFVEQTDKSKFEVQQSLDKLETLKKSLMQQYFG